MPWSPTPAGRVLEIQVKQPSRAVTGSGARSRPRPRAARAADAVAARSTTRRYLGTLVNAYIAQGGRAPGVPRGEAYVDVGTLHGYREALRLLESSPAPLTPPHQPATLYHVGRV